MSNSRPIYQDYGRLFHARAELRKWSYFDQTWYSALMFVRLVLDAGMIVV